MLVGESSELAQPAQARKSRRRPDPGGGEALPLSTVQAAKKPRSCGEGEADARAAIEGLLGRRIPERYAVHIDFIVMHAALIKKKLMDGVELEHLKTLKPPDVAYEWLAWVSVEHTHEPAGIPSLPQHVPAGAPMANPANTNGKLVALIGSYAPMAGPHPYKPFLENGDIKAVSFRVFERSAAVLLGESGMTGEPRQGERVPLLGHVCGYLDDADPIVRNVIEETDKKKRVSPDATCTAACTHPDRMRARVNWLAQQLSLKRADGFPPPRQNPSTPPFPKRALPSSYGGEHPPHVAGTLYCVPPPP
jgi:hypothetical protein